jgi:hypothetical protein
MLNGLADSMKQACRERGFEDKSELQDLGYWDFEQVDGGRIVVVRRGQYTPNSLDHLRTLELRIYNLVRGRVY